MRRSEKNDRCCGEIRESESLWCCCNSITKVTLCLEVRVIIRVAIVKKEEYVVRVSGLVVCGF